MRVSSPLVESLRRASPALVLAALLASLAPGLAGAQSLPGEVDEPALAPVQGQCVVLLHGLGRSHRSMGRIESALRGAGLDWKTALTWDPQVLETVHKAIEGAPKELESPNREGCPT